MAWLQNYLYYALKRVIMDLYNLFKLLAWIGLIISIISSIGLVYEKRKNHKIKYPTAILIINILVLIVWIIVIY